MNDWCTGLFSVEEPGIIVSSIAQLECKEFHPVAGTENTVKTHICGKQRHLSVELRSDAFEEKLFGQKQKKLYTHKELFNSFLLLTFKTAIVMADTQSTYLHAQTHSVSSPLGWATTNPSGYWLLLHLCVYSIWQTRVWCINFSIWTETPFLHLSIQSRY